MKIGDSLISNSAFSLTTIVEIIKTETLAGLMYKIVMSSPSTKIVTILVEELKLMTHLPV